MRRSRRVATAAGSAAAAALLVALSSAPVGAQTGAAILLGEVRDARDAPVVAVEVMLQDSAGATVASVSTGPTGRYLLRDIPSGSGYTVTFTRLGFDVWTRRRINLEAGETRRLDVLLSLRPEVLERIRVVARPGAALDPRQTGAATVIEERAVETMPTVDRDMVALAVLSPMVSLDGEAVSVAGQNTRYNALRVDGSLAQDLFGLSPSGVPGGQANAKALPFDAIRQYAVHVAPFDVRQSGFTGGLIEASTRSGGERWEARAFGYFRDGSFSGIADDSDVVKYYGQGVASDFRTATAGLTVGGPLGPVRLFVAGEIERRRRPIPGFNIGVADEYRLGLTADSVARLIDVLDRQYGMDAGTAGPYDLDNPLGNLFVRADASLGGAHRLTLRYNLISAEEDLPPARLGFDDYELGSSGTRLESTTQAAAVRLHSQLSQRTTNELLLSVQRSEDATRAVSPWPQVEVRLTTALDSLILRRPVNSGGAPLAHDNALDQSIVQLSDNLSYSAGAHQVTAGIEGSVFSVRRRFLPASRGIWRFNSLRELEANRPAGYERLVVEPGVDLGVVVSQLQLGAYLQDRWSASEELALTFGLRVDVPVALSSPPPNPEANAITGMVTDRVPSGDPLFSPRLGFNWGPDWGGRTQVRGGIGLFTGIPPLAWMADVYAENGQRTRFITCEGSAAPELKPAAPPGSCAGGGKETNTLTFFEEGFRYPQDLRGSIAVDRELLLGLVGTVEAVYTRALNQVSLADINLLPAEDGPFSPNDGYPEATGDRPILGTPLTIPTRFGPLEPNRIWPEYDHVIRIGNNSRDAALAVAAQLQRRFSDRLDLRLAYTYTRAVDTRSLAHPSAALNYGMTPTRVHPADLEPQFNSFARPHRLLGSAWTRLSDWGDGLDATLLYVGQSGLPYSYVYSSDLNGDGFPGPGAVAEAYNDLIFSPEGLTDLPTTAYQSFLVFQLAELDPCLGESAGAIVGRNVCRTPWSNRLDLRFAQGLNMSFGRVQLTADVLNMLNLLNSSWGLVQVAPPMVPLIHIDRRSGCPGLTCSLREPLVANYVGPRRRNDETGLPAADLPYSPLLPESQWRAQIGVRVEF